MAAAGLAIGTFAVLVALVVLAAVILREFSAGRPLHGGVLVFAWGALFVLFLMLWMALLALMLRPHPIRVAGGELATVLHSRPFAGPRASAGGQPGPGDSPGRRSR